MTDLCIVRPPTLVRVASISSSACPPIGPAYVAGSVRAMGRSVFVLDAVGEGIEEYRKIPGQAYLQHGLAAEKIVERIPDDARVIGFSCMFSHEWPEVRDLIQLTAARFPHAFLMAGGEHVTAAPDFSLEDCPGLSCCVLGEGEATAGLVTDAIARGAPIDLVPGIVFRHKGRIHRTLPAQRLRAVDDIPEPAWDLVPLEQYLCRELGFGVNRGRSMPMIATRGCPYQCTFCSSPVMWTTRYVTRDPALLIAEMRRYQRRYQIRNFDFYDLTAVVKRDWIVRFCRLLLEDGLDVTWQLPSGTRVEAIDEEVSRLMYASGCRNLTYAPESGSPEVLRRIKKKVDLNRMTLSMRSALGSGLNIKANLILGFPGETRREAAQTLAFAGRMALIGIHDVTISSFAPYPGSELFQGLRDTGRIPALNDDFFHNMMSYGDITRSVSWSESISNHELAAYRLLGTLTFYALSFARRPVRLYRLCRNILRGRSESKLEWGLLALARRLFGARQEAG